MQIDDREKTNMRYVCERELKNNFNQKKNSETISTIKMSNVNKLPVKKLIHQNQKEIKLQKLGK